MLSHTYTTHIHSHAPIHTRLTCINVLFVRSKKTEHSQALSIRLLARPHVITHFILRIFGFLLRVFFFTSTVEHSLNAFAENFSKSTLNCVHVYVTQKKYISYFRVLGSERERARSASEQKRNSVELARANAGCDNFRTKRE